MSPTPTLRRLALSLAAAALCGSAQAALISSESDAALAGATLYDFEAGPAGTWTSQGFGGLTVSVQNSAYATNARFSVDSDYAGSFNTRGQYHITNHGSEFQVLRLDFGGAASAFGFLLGATDSTWLLQAFNGSGQLLDSTFMGAVKGSNAGDYFGFSGLAGATYAVLTQQQDGYYAGGGVDYTFVDNIRVAGVSAVPEPGNVGMLLAGLAVLGSVARRRKTA